MTVGVVFLVGVTSLRAQGTWRKLVEAPGAKVWFDSASWVRNADSTVSMRLRTVEGHDERAVPDGAMIQQMDFDCARMMYRLTAERIEKGGKIVAEIPEHEGRGRWCAPSAVGSRISYFGRHAHALAARRDFGVSDVWALPYITDQP